MYSGLQVLTKANGSLFPYRCYEALYRAQVAPICLLEIEGMARRFPLAWRETETGAELVAVMGVAEGHNMGLDWDEALQPALPLVVEGYPFALGDTERSDEQGVLIDAGPPNGGEPIPIFSGAGEFTEEAGRRLRALQAFRASLPPLRAIGAALQRADLLVPWELAFQFGDHVLRIEGLRILERDPAKWQRMPELIAAFGLDLLAVATMHRMSLFRMQRLLDHYQRMRGRSHRLAAQG